MQLQMSSCNGCRTCEIACSFHHRGEFMPAVSSLKISDKADETGYVLDFMEENNGQRVACDGCKDLEVPLCLAYCWESEDLKRIIDGFLETRSSC